MVSRQFAPRMRLLGLLLISASVIMGLVVSALGVSTVSLSSPFAKKIMTEVRDAKSNISRQNNNNLDGWNQSSDHFVSASNGAFGQLDSASWVNSPSTAVGLDSTNPITTEVQIIAPELNLNEEKEPFTIPLWALIVPISILGILLWMTPMPGPSNTRRARYR